MDPKPSTGSHSRDNQSVGSEMEFKSSESASESDSLKKRPNHVYAEARVNSDDEPCDDSEDFSAKNKIYLDEEESDASVKFYRGEDVKTKERNKLLNRSETYKKPSYAELDSMIEEVRRLVQEKGFMDHPFNFDCVNTVYFLNAAKEYHSRLSELEQARYMNARRTALVQNPEVYTQFTCFNQCIDILNWLIKKTGWDMLYEIENEELLDYKDDKNLNYITLIKPYHVRNNYISMETLWLCTENSPIRYMIGDKKMKEILPKIQEQILNSVNSVINLCMVDIKKEATGKVFAHGFFDYVNCSRECRLRRRVFNRIERLLPVYAEFEKKCLNRMFKLSTKYWMNKQEKEKKDTKEGVIDVSDLKNIG